MSEDKKETILSKDEKTFAVYLEQQKDKAAAAVEASPEWAVLQFANNQFDEYLLACSRSHGIIEGQVRWDAQAEDIMIEGSKVVRLREKEESDAVEQPKENQPVG